MQISSDESLGKRGTNVLILVANLGSTSFKYRLFDMTDQRCLARGAVDRIGEPESMCSVEIGDWSETKISKCARSRSRRGSVFVTVD